MGIPMYRLNAAILAALAPLLLSTPGLASEAKEEIPQALQHVLEQDEAHAIKRIGRDMLSVSPQGVINADTIAALKQRLLASERANRMRTYLSMDLDFDGTVTEEELTSSLHVTRALRGLDEVEIALLRVDADLNTDGDLTFDEMRFYVIKAVDGTALRNSHVNMAEMLLALDLDGDGELTIPEMTRAVRMHKSKE